MDNASKMDYSTGYKIEWPEEYEYKETEDSDNIKYVKIYSKDTIKKFIKQLSVKNGFNFTFRTSAKRDYFTYYYYSCHHGVPSSKGQRVTYTKCPVKMRVLIHNDAIKDQSFPAEFMVDGVHNHSLTSAHCLRELRVSEETKDEFYFYFKQGMTPAQARRHHQLKHSLNEDSALLADKRLNPSLSIVQHLWRQSGAAGDRGVLNPFEKINSCDHKEVASNSEKTLIAERCIEDKDVIYIKEEPFDEIDSYGYEEMASTYENSLIAEKNIKDKDDICIKEEPFEEIAACDYKELTSENALISERCIKNEDDICIKEESEYGSERTRMSPS